ncbi:MAG TPA: hypothetical protein VD862_04130 [Candidatus Paceibacterota bacterium]|nr:hypothetical protein [Candidatus Paceibacterota bacterium]
MVPEVTPFSTGAFLQFGTLFVLWAVVLRLVFRKPDRKQRFAIRAYPPLAAAFNLFRPLPVMDPVMLILLEIPVLVIGILCIRFFFTERTDAPKENK